MCALAACHRSSRPHAGAQDIARHPKSKVTPAAPPSPRHPRSDIRPPARFHRAPTRPRFPDASFLPHPCLPALPAPLDWPDLTVDVCRLHHYSSPTRLATHIHCRPSQLPSTRPPSTAPCGVVLYLRVRLPSSEAQNLGLFGPARLLCSNGRGTFRVKHSREHMRILLNLRHTSLPHMTGTNRDQRGN